MVRLQELAPSLKRRFLKLFGPAIEVIWMAATDLEPIGGELVWVEELLFDLAVRGRMAVPFGGKLLIEWANIHLDGVTFENQKLVQGRYVMLEMRCLRQDPMQPTPVKATACASALSDTWFQCDFGRAQAMISSLGGQICEYNEPGRGLTIRAFFPAEADRCRVIQEPTVSGETRQVRILLVEDEGYVCDVASEILQCEGYEVFKARTPKEALAVFEQSRPVQLLVTDMVMPGMSGHDLSARLTSLDPELKTIYMSGYSPGVGPLTTNHEPSADFLQKPFTLETLTAKVKEVLGPPIS